MKKIKYIFGDMIVIQDIKENPFYESEYNRLDGIGSFTLDQINEQLENEGIKEFFEDRKLIRFENSQREEISKILKGMSLSELEELQKKGIFNIVLEYLVKEAITEKINATKIDNSPKAFAFLYEQSKKVK